MANWGIMGICHQLHFGRFLHEFRAWDSFNREAWRLWLANMIQHRTPDGENMEAWDDGHAGYRSEEVVLITDDGWLPMTDYPYDPF